MMCIRCKSCGVTPGKSWDSEWNQDKGFCPDCTRLYDQGEIMHKHIAVNYFTAIKVCQIYSIVSASQCICTHSLYNFMRLVHLRNSLGLLIVLTSVMQILLTMLTDE